MLRPKDCHIGMEFWSDGGHWRCTDVGQRTIIAIKLDEEDERNYGGPPYMVAESSLDEFDQKTCYATQAERDKDFPDTNDGPDISSTVMATREHLYRRGLEKKRITEWSEAEFRRVERLGAATREDSASEVERMWFLRRVLFHSDSGKTFYIDPDSNMPPSVP